MNHIRKLSVVINGGDMKMSIGIDVSMNTLDVVLYGSNLYKSKQFKNNEKGFSKI